MNAAPRVLAWALLMTALCAAPTAVAGSGGGASSGALTDAFTLPRSGPGFRLYGPVERRGSQHATVKLAALIARSARVLADRTPGPLLVVGDLSDEDGGPLRRHASHQSGRDVDLLFLARDTHGDPVENGRFVRFGGDGRCSSTRCDLRFDDARNWWLVRTLLASHEPAVQWIFVSNPLRRRLLRYAEDHGEHAELLRRARKVLRQPTGAAPHDDHFHVRIYCPAGDAGCRDAAPRWSWVSAEGRAAMIR